MRDLTILYHSSNREDSEFERKVIQTINNVREDIPVVSVTQEPMDFGTNICVGKHECCEVNLFRQRLIGLKAIKTKFVILAESDVLYCPDYFEKAPMIEGHIFLYTNVWVLYHMKEKNDNLFHFKERCEGTQIADRETMIKYCEKKLEGKPEWGTKGDHANKTDRLLLESGWTGEPVITCKTGDGNRKYTQVKRASPKGEIPYWGKTENVIWNYLS